MWIWPSSEDLVAMCHVVVELALGFGNPFLALGWRFGESVYYYSRPPARPQFARFFGFWPGRQPGRFTITTLAGSHQHVRSCRLFSCLCRSIPDQLLQIDCEERHRGLDRVHTQAPVDALAQVVKRLPVAKHWFYACHSAFHGFLVPCCLTL